MQQRVDGTEGLERLVCLCASGCDVGQRLIGMLGKTGVETAAAGGVSQRAELTDVLEEHR